MPLIDIPSSSNPNIKVTIDGLDAQDVGAIPTSKLAVAGGVASLDNQGKVPYEQLPGNKVTRSPNKPSNPNEGDIWKQQDGYFGTNLHNWIYTGNQWKSENFLQQYHFYWIQTGAEDFTYIVNWEVDVFPKLPVPISRINFAYLTINLVSYSPSGMNSGNYWRFCIFGTGADNTENYYNELNFSDGVTAGLGKQKTLALNIELTPGVDMRRLRIQAMPTGSPGLCLAHANLAYSFVAA